MLQIEFPGMISEVNIISRLEDISLALPRTDVSLCSRVSTTEFVGVVINLLPPLLKIELLSRFTTRFRM